MVTHGLITAGLITVKNAITELGDDPVKGWIEIVKNAKVSTE